MAVYNRPKQSQPKLAKNELPYNEQAEQAVLGSALLSKDAMYTVLSSLEAKDFYLAKHT